MTLLPNTDYVYQIDDALYLTHHSTNNHLCDIQNLTEPNPKHNCINWTYDPLHPSHQFLAFYEAQTYKDSHPELFI